jgi:hypothetical protein
MKPASKPERIARALEKSTAKAVEQQQKRAVVKARLEANARDERHTVVVAPRFDLHSDGHA